MQGSSYEHKETTRTTASGTGTGVTGTGEGMGEKISRKAGEAWEGVKGAMPGTGATTTATTTEHTGGGMGHTGMGHTTGGLGSAPMHTAQNPVTGGTRAHQTSTGAAVDQAWQDVKSKVPGTKEHKATNPTVM